MFTAYGPSSRTLTHNDFRLDNSLFTNQGTLSQWPDQGLGWFDGASFGYIPQTEVGVGLPHAQIADMEVRAIPGGYELWISCTSEGVAILTVQGTCQTDLGFGGPGDAVLCLCGDPLASGGEIQQLDITR